MPSGSSARSRRLPHRKARRVSPLAATTGRRSIIRKRPEFVRTRFAELDSGQLLLDWSRAAAQPYAGIRAKLESAGTPIGNMDLMIAAHARSAGAVLVTNNEKRLRRVEGLKVENWA